MSAAQMYITWIYIRNFELGGWRRNECAFLNSCKMCQMGFLHPALVNIKDFIINKIKANSEIAMITIRDKRNCPQ